jgi:thioredoxin 1
MERLLMKLMRMIYYTASWCGPCRTFKPQALDEAASRGIKVHVVDVDVDHQMASYDNVMSVPTVLVVDVGNNDELDRVVGASLPTLRKTLDKLGEVGYNGQLNSD